MLKKCSSPVCKNPNSDVDKNLPLTQFNKNRAMKDGFANQCKHCTRTRAKVKRIQLLGANRDPVKEYKKSIGMRKCSKPNCLNPNTDKEGYLKLENFFISKDKRIRASCKHCEAKRHYTFISTHTDWLAEYKIKNKEKIKLYYQKKYLDNKDKIDKRNKEWRIKNLDKIRANHHKKSAADPQYRLAKNLRTRLKTALHNQLLDKRVSALKDLGCNWNFFIEYIEGLWVAGMSWDNYGSGPKRIRQKLKIPWWDIDHIIPLSNFNLTNKKNQKKAVHYSNLQPLWHLENLSKGNKIVKF